MLLVLLSAGVSKSRNEIVNVPVSLIAKNDASVPPNVHVTASLAVNVCTAVEVSAIDLEDVAPVAELGPVITGGVVL